MAEGARWLRAAAESGLAQAQCDLGAMYLLKNAGVKQSYKEALLWLRRGARQGDALALNNLGIVNAKGFRDYSLGFFDRVRFANATTNHVEAYKWFTLAAEKGYAAALNDRALIEARMSSEQLERAKRRLLEFKQAKDPWVDGWGNPIGGRNRA